jgi:hypothetical protein
LGELDLLGMIETGAPKDGQRAPLGRIGQPDDIA